MSFHAPNKYRRREGPMASDHTFGNLGAFVIPGPHHLELICISSDQLGWEHVSVSTTRRCPNWIEMNFIKDLFWDDEDCVMQLHPPKSEYVNNHPFCLHLWRPIDQSIPRPQSALVGLVK